MHARMRAPTLRAVAVICRRHTCQSSVRASCTSPSDARHSPRQVVAPPAGARARPPRSSAPTASTRFRVRTREGGVRGCGWRPATGGSTLCAGRVGLPVDRPSSPHCASAGGAKKARWAARRAAEKGRTVSRGPGACRDGFTGDGNGRACSACTFFPSVGGERDCGDKKRSAHTGALVVSSP